MSANVVVFDDDNDVVELITVIFGKKGFTVHAYWELEDFIQKLTDLDPCLVLMDYMVPPIAGKTAARQIKSNENLSHIPVVLISGVENIEDIADKARADAYLKKPFETADLEALIDKFCSAKAEKTTAGRSGKKVG